MIETDALLILPRLQVQNANAISGPLSWGFPAVTAFTGFVHALERRLADEFDVRFGGVGIISHRFEPQVSQPAGRRTRVFNLTRNPVDKKGETAALVEEGRAHLELSLVIAVEGLMDKREGQAFAETVQQEIETMRLAGGSILPTRAGKRFAAQWWLLPEDEVGQQLSFHRLRRRLLPGFSLVSAEPVLRQHMETRRGYIDPTHPQAALEALLDLSRLNIEPEQSDPDNPEKAAWIVRSQPGWLVPIPVGYAALSPLYPAGKVTNARDSETPFRFVESLYSLGQWVSPHRIERYPQLLWDLETDPEQGVYRCTNSYYSDTLNPAASGTA